ncbi:MAG: hypothetical protein H6717_18395 [Polyangiaceae bacterium]|nr:hypothetical protein [Polyangiaceae bacterium]
MHLALIEERRLHLVRGYSSLYDLCVRWLGMSEGQAHRSVSGAHAAKCFPLALEMIADGRLHLTGLSLIAKRLTPENHAQLLEDVAGKTKAEILIVLARWFPKPDVPDRVEPVSGGSHPSEQGSLGLDGAPRSRVEPLSEGRFLVHFSGSAELKGKLEHAQNLMSHVSRKLEVVFERALDALIRELENKQWGKSDHPRRSGGRKDRRPSRADKREVYERDGAQCSYVSPSGTRCTARAFLQYDHVDPRGKGGGGEARNGRLLCAAHNDLHARQAYGSEIIDEKVRRARSRAEQGGAAQTATDKFDKLRAALVTMGFKKAECCKVVATLGTEAERLPLDQLIREALLRLTPR